PRVAPLAVVGGGGGRISSMAWRRQAALWLGIVLAVLGAVLMEGKRVAPGVVGDLRFQRVGVIVQAALLAAAIFAALWLSIRGVGRWLHAAAAALLGLVYVAHLSFFIYASHGSMNLARMTGEGYPP